MNSSKRAKSTESEDMVYTEYKGKRFAIPRSDYVKPLPTILGQPSLASTASNLTSVSQHAAAHPNSKSPQKRENHPTGELQNNPFSLESLVASRETFLNDPTPTSSTQTISTTTGDPQPAIADSLIQLKSSVVDLIDRTISDIETKQLLKERQEMLEETTPTPAYLHPGGDSPKMEKVTAMATTTTTPFSHRVQNLQLLKTDSFEQSKRDVRKKLYREIETILMRLKDMDIFE